MSKILKLPNAKPITCACCGCIYEFESGDTVITVINDLAVSFSQKYKILARRLECPNCHYDNDLEFEAVVENENS